MSLPNLISNYTSFNEWANKRIVDWLSTLDESVLYAPVQSSYPSLDYTVQHILRGQKFWLLFITGQSTAGFSWAVREGEARNILQELNENSSRMKEAFSSFSEAELLEILHLDMPWAKNDRCRYDYIQHIINHSSFHRGQLVTIARTLGVTENIPNTDYNIFNTF